MRIAIYSPYLDTAGGGEKYILTIAEALSDAHTVDILLDSHLFSIGREKIEKKIKLLHGLDLAKVNFQKAPIGKGSSFFNRLLFLKKYDCLFYLTDGSVFLSTVKRSYIHFQVPFKNTAASNFWGKFKLSTWEKAIYNSFFTKEIVEKTWPLTGEVIYPPVETENFNPLPKKNQILSVGRFFGYLKDKKHQVMIDAFKDLAHQLKGWSLHLAGGAGEGDRQYLDDLKKSADGFKVYFYPNAPFSEIKKLYGESKIYWHAAGFEEKDPQKFEHFGIATVEAMSAGCVPVVVNKGGQKEIVDNTKNGFLWDSLNELEKYTIKVAKNEVFRETLSENAIDKSKNFSKEIFINNIKKLLNA